MRIVHTMLRVGDLDRSIAFYTEALGMRQVRRTDRPEQRYTCVFVGFDGDRQGAELELTYNYGIQGYTHGDAFGHIAIEVPDAAAVCARVRDAPALGGKVTREAGPVKGGTTVIAFVEDPDGYKIELVERPIATPA